jgi:hypothetical protein
MRVTIALAVLAVFISLGGCSRPSKPAYAKPHPTTASSVKPRPLPVRKPPQSRSASAHAPATAEATFKAAQEKAKLSGVQTLTQKDIEGLSLEQIKQLRGY